MERERPRVLVVDDDPLMLKAIRRQLGEQWIVDTAVGATTAAGMMQDNGYDAIVSDYNMPGRDGLWLLEWTRRKFPTTRRILLSSDPPRIFMRQITSGLVQRYVPKAQDLISLEDALVDLI